eukprot:381251-Pyramimonas_sp.AAC.1
MCSEVYFVPQGASGYSIRLGPTRGPYPIHECKYYCLVAATTERNAIPTVVANRVATSFTICAISALIIICAISALIMQSGRTRTSTVI